MRKYKFISKPAKREIYALLASGLLLIIMFNTIACFIDVLPWEVVSATYHPPASIAAHAHEAFSLTQMLKDSFIAVLFLVTLLCGVFFSTFAHALAKRLLQIVI